MKDMLQDRRGFLRRAAAGFGYTAFAGLAAMDSMTANGRKNPLLPEAPHFPPKAKRVIFLFMQGTPTQHETFDYNPELAKYAGMHSEMKLAIGTQGGKILPPVFDFLPSGESGLPISEIFPHLREHADDSCLLNGMHTDSPAHPQASIFTHTGSITFVRPSMGSWVVYGLGTENQDLPGFVTMNPPPVGGASLYGSAFLPASYQGTKLNVADGQDPVEKIRNLRMGLEAQRRQLDYVQELNQGLLERTADNEQIEGVTNRTNSHSECRRRCPKRWTWRPSRRASARCTASARTRRAHSALNVCSRGAWPSKVFDSSPIFIEFKYTNF